MPVEGLVIATKYRLKRMIRRGGMGSVWEALHLTLESAVVIKFVRFDRVAGGGSESEDVISEQLLRTRFEREARAAAQIRSANVVQILDYGVDRGTPYLVMEMLEGEDLASRLGRHGRMSLVETASIVRQIARALERAHGAGLVHRDLKPQNVFLARDGSEEVVKVLDFGVAKELRGDRKADDSTVDGVVIGTPSYMSPEQAMGRSDIDHRSDLWSLGVIAFRAVTGKKPFEAQLMLEAIVKICSAPLPVPSAIAPDLGKDVDAFFERALARPPEDRFQTARELAQALDFLATGGTRSATEGLPVVRAPGPSAPTFEVAERARNVATSAPTLDAMMASETGAPPPLRRRSPWGLIGVGASMAVVAVIGIGVLRGSSGPAAAPASSALAGPASGGPAAAPAAPPPSAERVKSEAPASSVAGPTASAVVSASAKAPVASPPPQAAPRPPSGKRPRPNVGY